MNNTVQKFLLEQNKEHYERMAKAFPEEPIWRKAFSDTDKLLKKEG